MSTLFLRKNYGRLDCINCFDGGWMDTFRQLMRLLLFIILCATSVLSYAATSTGWSSVLGGGASSCHTLGYYTDLAVAGGTYVSGNTSVKAGIQISDDVNGQYQLWSQTTVISSGLVGPKNLGSLVQLYPCALPVTCATAGSSVSGVTGTFYTGTGAMPSDICVGGCQFKPQGLGVGMSSGWGLEAGRSTGATCTSNTVTPLPPAPDPKTTCVQQGMGFGEFNGQTVCVPATTTQNTSQKTTTNTPATGGSSTTYNTTTTSCTGDGSCSTTTTTTTTSGGSGPGGTGPGSTTTAPTTKKDDQPQSAFCEENPNSPVCIKSTFNAPSCDSAPACSGDAVQCAQAKLAFELKCLATKDDDYQKYAKGVLGGNDPLSSNMPDPKNPTEIPVGTLNTSEIFAASCPTNPQFQVFGKSYQLKLQPLCDLGELMGKLNVMIALIGGLWIIAGSVKGT